jgi:hypothetical protein
MMHADEMSRTQRKEEEKKNWAEMESKEQNRT